ncbi:MAG: hypothetical protein NT040_15835 [Bacteroidetes bacterium]|nr:hypothetical protein [Bacteroidota bacterium]
MRRAIQLIILFAHLMFPAMGQNPFISHDSIVFVESALKKVSKNVNFTIVPGPTFGAADKLGFAVLPMVVYNLSKTDKVSPPSSTAILFYFDFHGSWETAVKQSIYWNQNKWRAFFSMGVGDLKLKYFGIGNDTVVVGNNDTNYVWTRQKEFIVSLVCFRKIFRGLYGGLEYHYSLSNYQGSDSASTMELTGDGVPTGKLSQTVLIPAFVWDNRDNIFWSVKGYYASLSLQFSNRSLFSSKDYSILSGWVNGYHSLLRSSTRLTIAWHLYMQAGWGDLPYRIYANYGHGDEVTGYTGGKYVNYSETTVQTELRYDLWKFIALGGYAGTGKVFRSYTVFGQSAWLHFGGIRLYLNVIPRRNMRVCLDAAIARKDYGFYIGIGQGF